jgi:hypothetical protein
MTSKTTTLDFKARSTADPKPAQQAANEQPCAVDAQGERLHRIVVVGGGAGGLELVTRLGDTLGKERKAEVTLIEKARTHRTWGKTPGNDLCIVSSRSRISLNLNS